MTVDCGRWRALPLLLALLQAYPLVARQSVPLDPAAQRIKDQVEVIPIGGKLTVRKTDGTEYHGRLQAIEPQMFSIREVDLKATVTIPYSEVDRIRKNYGGKGFGGRRVDPKRSLIAGAIIVGALFTIVFVAVAKDKS
ncbi:MAG: hypothetical protein ACR2NN_20935 [Bryobacteraceae bacterium]